MKTPVNLLWTGGWDSTFRLLSLVIAENRIVQPHYIVDVARQSSILEMATMGKIKACLDMKDVGYRVLPIKVVPLYDITIDKVFSEAHSRLKLRSHLGSQYAWLASYARSCGIDDLELSIHQDDTAEVFVRDSVESVHGNWKLSDAADRDVQTLFGNVRFPLLRLSKLHMKDIAREQGFLDMLELSWFCHQPVADKPCGRCNPCRYTIEEGMSYRFPRRALWRHRIPRLAWKVYKHIS